MPVTVAEMFGAAGVGHSGAVPWGTPVGEQGPGVYVVSLNADPHDTRGSVECPISYAKIGSLLIRRAELTVDGDRPDEEILAMRICGFWLPDEPVLYIGKATSLGNRIGQYYSTPLGARSPHAGGWFLKTLNNINDLFVHYGGTTNPVDSESQMLAAFVSAVTEPSRSRLHDPERPFPFANLEYPQGTRKRHGIKGARQPKASQSGAATSAPRAVASQSQLRSGLGRSTPHHRTQRITAVDIRAGRIRIPSTGSTKRLFPREPNEISLMLKGLALSVRWDPRYGPDKQRSGVLSIGRQNLEGAVKPDEVLRVRREPDGTITLD